MTSLLKQRSLSALVPAVALALLGAGAATAVDLDLTSAGSSASIGGGIFAQTDPQPTGTGVIDPFVRLDAMGQEQGFNTDHRPLKNDLADVKSGQWTHSVLVGELVPVDLGGVPYVRFLLDINQTGASSLLSLDELRVFTAPVPDLNDNATLFAQNLIYDLGAGNRILLDYSLNAGSGSGDMFFYLPASLFAGLGGQYVYLYSKFGASGAPYASNDGFEEWSHIIFSVPVESGSWSALKALYRD